MQYAGGNGNCWTDTKCPLPVEAVLQANERRLDVRRMIGGELLRAQVLVVLDPRRILIENVKVRVWGANEEQGTG